MNLSPEEEKRLRDDAFLRMVDRAIANDGRPLPSPFTREDETLLREVASHFGAPQFGDLEERLRSLAIRIKPFVG